MDALYPLRFRPKFRDYLWGGERLASVLGKEPDVGPPVAESWEIVDHDDDQSVVMEGALAGKTLADIVATYGAELLGERAWESIQCEDRPDHLKGRFPLLFKFLDANRALSVQVHPNDALGAKLVPPDLGKTEAWVVMDAEPGSQIFAGLKEGVDATTLRDAMEAGETDRVLHSFEPQIGDCVFIPAGTVHAIGAGLLIAEIQQASDTTYRMFDWNRVGADGKPRELHIEAAIAAIDYQRGPVGPQDPQPGRIPQSVRLVSCTEFVLERWSLNAESVAADSGEDFQLIAITAGNAMLSWEGGQAKLSRGHTMLVPARLSLAIQADEQFEALMIRPGG